ncbi:hypothetical protein Efla_002441 [Eimeria flavescens]
MGGEQHYRTTHSLGGGKRREASVPHQSLKNRRPRIAEVVVVVYILVALVVAFLCKRTLNSLTKAGSSHRRLAGDGDEKDSCDEELDHILSECVDMELESGRLPFIVVSQERNTLEPIAKKARLVDVILSTISSFQAAGDPSSFVSGWGSSPPNFAHSSLKQHAPQFILRHDSGAVPLASQDSDTSKFMSTESEGRSIVCPPFEQESSLHQISATAGDGGGAEVDSQQLVAQEDRKELEDRKEREIPMTEPFTMCRRRLRHTLRSAAAYLENHPFFRLPDMLPGAVQRDFRPQLPCSKAMPSRSALLGKHMRVDEWWTDFIRHFFTDYPRQRRPLTSRLDCWHNYRLDLALRRAVKLLKTGVRPEHKDVIYLKRKLLVSQYSVSYFAISRWDAWREDDSAFRAAQGEKDDTLGISDTSESSEEEGE